MHFQVFPLQGTWTPPLDLLDKDSVTMEIRVNRSSLCPTHALVCIFQSLWQTRIVNRKSKHKSSDQLLTGHVESICAVQSLVPCYLEIEQLFNELNKALALQLRAVPPGGQICLLHVLHLHHKTEWQATLPSYENVPSACTNEPVFLRDWKCCIEHSLALWIGAKDIWSNMRKHMNYNARRRIHEHACKCKHFSHCCLCQKACLYCCLPSVEVWDLSFSGKTWLFLTL